MNLGLRDLLTSRGYIFAEKMLRSVTPVVAVVVGIVTLLWKGFGPIKRCKWVYILLCQALLMLVLGYLYDRAYAPLATVAFIIVAMAVDGLLSRWQWGRWLRIMAIALCLVLSAYSMSHAMGVLHRLKTFEDEIYREIVSAPRHAILHERQFTGYSRFATPLRYSSFDYFNRESTYCAYYNKDNVQFVNDSIYARYHTGRLLDGGQYLPLVSDRPDIADTVLRFPDQDYMIVVLNVDTLKPSPQFANYYLFPSDTVLTEQDRQFRNKYGLETEFTLRSYFPLYYQQRHLLVLPLIDDVTSHIVLQLDYEGDLGNLTLSRKPIVTN